MKIFKRLLSRGSGVRVSPGAPLISLESNTCNHFWNGFSFDFRSIRSSSTSFGRNFEAQTDPLGPNLAEFHVLFQLGVDVPDLFVIVPHPKAFKVLRNTAFTDVSKAKTPESMRSALGLIEYCQDRMQPSSQDVRLA